MIVPTDLHHKALELRRRDNPKSILLNNKQLQAFFTTQLLSLASSDSTRFVLDASHLQGRNILEVYFISSSMRSISTLSTTLSVSFHPFSLSFITFAMNLFRDLCISAISKLDSFLSNCLTSKTSSRHLDPFSLHFFLKLITFT